MSYAGNLLSRSVQPIAPRCGLASGGTAWWSSYAAILTRSTYVMPASVGGASDIQVVAGNFSPAAYPEDNTNAISTSACLEYNGSVYLFTWGSATSGVQANSALIPSGARVKSDPLPVYIPAGASYAIRKLDRADPPMLTAAVASGAVSAITVTSQGVGGWTQPPAVTLSGGGGSGASAAAAINAAGQITGVTITSGGSGYTSAPTATIATQIPVGRNGDPELGEFMAFYAAGGSVPTSPFGADLVTTAATGAGGTTLTFASTSAAGFNGAAVAIGAVVNAPGLLPQTKVMALSSTTLTISPAATGVTAGTMVRVLANRSVNTNAGNGPLAVLGRVKNRSAAVIIFGDSIAAGRFAQGTLTTSAGSASGSTTLTFASTATLTAVPGVSLTPALYPGMELPVYTGVNGGVVGGTTVAAITGTTVTLSQPLTAAVASGATITFGRQYDSLGNIGYIEKGLVTGYGTAGLAPAAPFSNMALSGDTLTNFLLNGGGLRKMSFLGEGWTHAFDEYGINDWSSSAFTTLAAYQAAKVAFWNILGTYGIKVVACTVLPETTSTDGWMTAGNQTAKNSSFAVGGLESQGNDWLRAQVSAGVLWDVVDAATAASTAQDSQIWSTVTLNNGGAATAYAMTLDGVHPVGPGQAPLAAAVAARIAAGTLC